MTTNTASEAKGQRILVVDDETSISDLIATSLKFVGFDVRTAATGSQALTIAEEFKPHAMILDVMLPDLDGFEVCRQIRNEGIEVGVLFLSAKDEMKDKVQGLTIGGDDYMTKPFSLEELVARLRALLRRIGVVEMDQDEEKIRFADLELDEATHEVRRAGILVEEQDAGSLFERLLDVGRLRGRARRVGRAEATRVGRGIPACENRLGEMLPKACDGLEEVRFGLARDT